MTPPDKKGNDNSCRSDDQKEEAVANKEQARQEQLDQLARVLDVVARPALRRAFLANPMATLEQNGVNREIVPMGLIDVLAGMTFEELGVVARLVSYEEGIAIGQRQDGVKLCGF